MDAQWEAYRRKKEILIQLEVDTMTNQVTAKEFIPSFPNLPRLSSYKYELPAAYWTNWAQQSYEGLQPFKSWICPQKLKQVALNSGFKGKEEHLVRVLRRLENGCDIGCKGTGRLPTRYPNSKSAEEYGERVADTFQG